VPVLVELFTSEGCSSCPPADQLLIDLLHTQPVAGVRIVALSEHVDYWNQLGWKDPFSSAQFSDRQNDYGRALGDEVYTPQIVIDGRHSAVGSSRADVLAAIRNAGAKTKAQLTLTWTSDLQAAVTVAPNAVAAGADVYVAITEDGLTSSVRRGENEGKQLTHDAVTRRLTRIGATSRQGSFSQTVPIAPMLDPSSSFSPRARSSASTALKFAEKDAGGPFFSFPTLRTPGVLFSSNPRESSRRRDQLLEPVQLCRVAIRHGKPVGPPRQRVPALRVAWRIAQDQAKLGDR
jgi:hypothetical protein